MTTAIQPIAGLDDATMLALVSGGDTSRLSAAQKTAYYLARCETAGLDPRVRYCGPECCGIDEGVEVSP